MLKFSKKNQKQLDQLMGTLSPDERNYINEELTTKEKVLNQINHFNYLTFCLINKLLLCVEEDHSEEGEPEHLKVVDPVTVKGNDPESTSSQEVELGSKEHIDTVLTKIAEQKKV